MGSCGDDVDSTATDDIEVAVEAELDKVIDASTAYVFEASVTNCMAYKISIEEYLDTVKSFEDCLDTAEQQQDFDKLIEEGENELSTLNC